MDKNGFIGELVSLVMGVSGIEFAVDHRLQGSGGFDRVGAGTLHIVFPGITYDTARNIEVVIGNEGVEADHQPDGFRWQVTNLSSVGLIDSQAAYLHNFPFFRWHRKNFYIIFRKNFFDVFHSRRTRCTAISDFRLQGGGKATAALIQQFPVPISRMSGGEVGDAEQADETEHAG